MQVMWVLCSGIFLLGVRNSAAQTAGDILWEFNTGNHASHPALGTDGTIYVGGSNKLYAINPNGTRKWDFPISSPGHPVLGPDGTIYVGEYNPPQTRFLAINPNGTMKWEFSQQVHGEIRAAVAGDGTIYLTSQNFLHALSSDGRRLWGFTNEFAAVCAGPGHFGFPAIGNDGTIYVPAGTPDNRLFAFSTNGMTNWTFSTGRVRYEDGGECGLIRYGESWSAPAIGVDGTVYIGACQAASDASERPCILYAINSTGSTNWHCFLGNNATPGDGAPAIGADGAIYMNIRVAPANPLRLTNKLAAITTTGSNTWNFVIPGFFPNSSPVVTADGTVLIGSTEGKLFAVGVDGTSAGFFSIPGLVSYATVASDGTIYVTSWSGIPGNGKLYAVAGRAGLAGTSWPMFRRDSRQSGRTQIQATTQPTLLSLRRIEPTQFELSYTGERSRDYSIEASSNLLQWRLVNTFFSSRERVQFRDSAAATAQLRFYRLVSP